MWSESLRIWGKAIKFYADNFISLIPIIPFLFMPFIGNLLLSVIIKQEIIHKRTFLSSVLSECWQYLYIFIYLTLTFAFLPAITEDIPIVGEYFDVKYSRYKAMLPNVLVFEKITDKTECRARCQSLVYNEGIAIRTIYTIPALIGALLIIGWVICVTVFQPIHPILILIVAFILIVPLSSAANTFLYLMLAEKHMRENG